MNEITPKIGYVSVSFTPETTQGLVDWAAKNIPLTELSRVSINTNPNDQNITHKAHLTLFFGFDDAKVDKEEMTKYLSGLSFDKFQFSGLGTFSTSNPGLKILMLKVVDTDGKLLEISQRLSQFPHFSEYQKPEFVPHLTIAIVTDTFDFSHASLEGLPELVASEVAYHLKYSRPVAS